MRVSVLLVILACAATPAAWAQQTNDHLYVSAESGTFGNTIAGSMVIEVVVRDPLKLSVSADTARPDVTVNGDSLGMVQRSDGSWAAYFADADSARAADANAAGGEGLDFGFFCGPGTDSSVLGMDVSDTEGVAVPALWSGAVNGESGMSPCTGSPQPGNANNVVRDARQPAGTDPVSAEAWPLIQLFDLDDGAEVSYARHTGEESVTLNYGEISGISAKFDRVAYPAGAEIILEVSDIQLNQDPTSRDSWTFGVSRPYSTFYMAFDRNGGSTADGTAALINLAPKLDDLGFEDNGVLSIDDNPVTTLKTNSHQGKDSISDGTATYDDIVTLLETGKNSGVFTSYGKSSSVIGVKTDAPKNSVANFGYNDDDYSILFGVPPASLDIVRILEPGTAIPVRVTDMGLNSDSEIRETLSVSSESAIIPVVRIDDPVTLASADGVRFHERGSSDYYEPALYLDSNADRLLLDVQAAPDGFTFDKISISLGVSAQELSDFLIREGEQRNEGTNWFHYDIRSLARLGVNLGSISVGLSAGPDDPSPVSILNASSGQGLVRIGNGTAAEIGSKSGPLHLVLDVLGRLPGGAEKHPVMADFFSFGVRDGVQVSSAIYRLELRETGKGSGIFEGSVEYVVPNQLNIDDPDLVESLRFVDDSVRFMANGRLSVSDIMITYPDNYGGDITQLSGSTLVERGSDAPTNSGSVALVGEPRVNRVVTIILDDPDLNTNSALVETYRVVNNPVSPHVDTVGSEDGGWLLDVLIKGERYKRCTVLGQPHGGLGASGFALVETAEDTGVFTGRFKVPVWICSPDGTTLVPAAGGSIVARYNDFADSSGLPNVFTTKSSGLTSQAQPPQLGSASINVPPPGLITSTVVRGVISGSGPYSALEVTVTNPAGEETLTNAQPSERGAYTALISVGSSYQPGNYTVSVSYLGSVLGELYLEVTEERVPFWIMNLAGKWAAGGAPDAEFAAAVDHLILRGVLPGAGGQPVQEVPQWLQSTAGLWAGGHISDDEFVAVLEYLILEGFISG